MFHRNICWQFFHRVNTNYTHTTSRFSFVLWLRVVTYALVCSDWISEIKGVWTTVVIAHHLVLENTHLWRFFHLFSQLLRWFNARLLRWHSFALHGNWSCSGWRLGGRFFVHGCRFLPCSKESSADIDVWPWFPENAESDEALVLRWFAAGGCRSVGGGWFFSNTVKWKDARDWK